MPSVTRSMRLAACALVVPVLAGGCAPSVELLTAAAWPAEWESLALYAPEDTDGGARVRSYASRDGTAKRAIGLGLDVAEKVDRAIDKAGDEARPRSDVEPMAGGVPLVIVLDEDDPTPEPLRRLIEREIVSIKAQIAAELESDTLDTVGEASGRDGGRDGGPRDIEVTETPDGETVVVIEGETFTLEQLRERTLDRIARDMFDTGYDALNDAQRAEVDAELEQRRAEARERRDKLRDALMEILTVDLLEKLMPLGMTAEQAREFFPAAVADDVRWAMIRPGPGRAWSGLKPASHKIIDRVVDNPIARALAHGLVPLARGWLLGKYADIVEDAAMVLELRARGIDHESVGVEDPFEDWVVAAGKDDGGKLFSDDGDDGNGADENDDGGEPEPPPDADAEPSSPRG